MVHMDIKLPVSYQELELAHCGPGANVLNE